MPKSGDIVLIKMHPASGQELKKFRPAIILQYVSSRNFVTFIPLTSQVKGFSNFECRVEPTTTNGLEKESLAICWYIQTVGIRRIQKHLGRLDPKILKDIRSLSKKYLHL